MCVMAMRLPHCITIALIFLTHSCTRGHKFSSLRSTDVPLSTGITSHQAAPSLKHSQQVKVSVSFNAATPPLPLPASVLQAGVYF